jgi:hypothetical protein
VTSCDFLSYTRKLGIFFSIFFISFSVLSSDKFSPENCEYQVSFPQKPILEQQHTQQGVVKQALLEYKGTIFRADCMERYIEDYSLFLSALPDSLMQIAKISGLSQISVNVEESKHLGIIGTYRGYKQVGENTLFMTGATYFGTHSAMQLFVMESPEVFPSTHAHAFLTSIRR